MNTQENTTNNIMKQGFNLNWNYIFIKLELILWGIIKLLFSHLFYIKGDTEAYNEDVCKIKYLIL